MEYSIVKLRQLLEGESTQTEFNKLLKRNVHHLDPKSFQRLFEVALRSRIILTITIPGDTSITAGIDGLHYVLAVEQRLPSRSTWIPLPNVSTYDEPDEQDYFVLLDRRGGATGDSSEDDEDETALREWYSIRELVLVRARVGVERNNNSILRLIDSLKHQEVIGRRRNRRRRRLH